MLVAVAEKGVSQGEPLKSGLVMTHLLYACTTLGASICISGTEASLYKSVISTRGEVW